MPIDRLWLSLLSMLCCLFKYALLLCIPLVGLGPFKAVVIKILNTLTGSRSEFDYWFEIDDEVDYSDEHLSDDWETIYHLSILVGVIALFLIFAHIIKTGQNH
jgi:hypothetical protein